MDIAAKHLFELHASTVIAETQPHAIELVTNVHDDSPHWASSVIAAHDDRQIRMPVACRLKILDPRTGNTRHLNDDSRLLRQDLDRRIQSERPKKNQEVRRSR